MLHVSDYRKLSKKSRKLRSWTILVISVVLGVLIATVFMGYHLVSEKQQEEYFDDIVTIKESTIKIHLSYNITNEIHEIYERILKIAKKKELHKVEIFLEGKLISKYDIRNPGICVLNGKGEKDIAMKVSKILIDNKLTIENYGNFLEFGTNSMIILRSPFFNLVTQVTNILGCTNFQVIQNLESIKDIYSPIVVILGKDFSLKE